MPCSLQNHKSINEIYQTDPIVYSCRHLQLFWCIAKKTQLHCLQYFFIDINEQLKLNYWDMCFLPITVWLTHMFQKGGLFYSGQESHGGIIDEIWITLFLWKKGGCFYILASFGPSSPLMTFTWCHLELVSWDTGTVWNNQSLFFRKIQKHRSRKPINIWCLDRYSLKYSFPQVKLLSMLLIKRLQKEYCLSFFFSLSLVFFYFIIILWKIEVMFTFCVCMCVFFTK